MANIGFDIDGVITDISEKIVEYCRLYLNKIITPTDICEYNYLSYCGVSDDAINRYWADPVTYRNIKLMKDADVVLNRLINDGHKLYFITARPKTLINTTIDFFCEFLPSHSWNIYFTDHEGKAKIINENKVEFFVDDRLETVIDLASKCPNTLVYLFDAPYNYNNLSIYTVNNLDDYYSEVDFFTRPQDFNKDWTI